VSDFLDEDGGGENLERGADEVLSGLRVAEADHEPLETRLAVCVAEEHDTLHQAKLVEEAPEHHLLLPNIGEVPTLQQDLVRDRDTVEIVPMRKCVEATLADLHSPVDSSLRSGGVNEINMSVKSSTGPGVELHIPDLSVLAEGPPDVSRHQLIPGSAFECEVHSSSAIPDTRVIFDILFGTAEFSASGVGMG